MRMEDDNILQAMYGVLGDEQNVERIPAQDWEGSVGVQPPSVPAFTPTSSPMADSVLARSGDKSSHLSFEDAMKAVSAPAPTSRVSVPPTQAVPFTPGPTPRMDDGYGSELDDAALKAALERQKQNIMNTNLARAANSLTAGVTRTKTMSEPLDALEKAAGLEVEGIKTRRKGKDDEVARGMNILKAASEKELEDPNSPASKFAQNMAKSLAPRLGLSVPDGLSAGQLKRAGIDVDSMLSKLHNMELLASSKEQAKDIREQSLELRKQEKLDKDVGKISDKLEKHGIPKAVATLKEVDSLMEGIDSDKKDLPGFGLLGGLTPDFATSTEGQKLRQAVQRLANIELKDRSGAAVTDQEYARFKKEFGSGTWKTEAQLRNGLRMYRDVLDRVTREVQAGSPKAALAEYQTRPGSVSNIDIPGSKGEAPSRDTSSIPSEVERLDKSGKVAIFDSQTKKFLRWK